MIVMNLETALKKETKKWTQRIEKEMKNIKIKGKDSKVRKNERFLENIRAYISDSKHFAKKGDLVRSFEAILWAWAWLEILKELDVLE